MASNDPSRLISQWVAILQDNPQRDAIWSCVTNAPNATVFAQDREIEVDLSGKDENLAFFSVALEYSFFPHVRRPRYAEHMGIQTRTDAKNWAHKQIKENLRDSRWMHATSLGDPAGVFARVFP